MRAKRNEPAFVVHTAEVAARAAGVSLADLASATVSNTTPLAQVPPSPTKRGARANHPRPSRPGTQQSIMRSTAHPPSLASLLLASCASSKPRPPTAGGPGGGAAITISPTRSTVYETWIFDDHRSLPAIADDGSAVAAL